MEFELYRRDGHSKHIVFKAKSLRDVAKKAAAKAGIRVKKAVADGGWKEDDD